MIGGGIIDGPEWNVKQIEKPSLAPQEFVDPGVKANADTRAEVSASV
jgi:hypothetical protein